MTVISKPFVRLRSTELAAWLKRQGSWWTVDGDPLLMGRISFPCHGEELAEAVSSIKKMLRLIDNREPPTASRQEISADELDSFAWFQNQDRVFQFAWEDAVDDWLLIEDKEMDNINRVLEASTE